MDVAKTLFVRQGYDGVSMREITVAAKVNVASIHYHFGSKQDLLFETLRRSARPLIEQRMQGLNNLQKPYRLEDLVLAFIRPVFSNERVPRSRRLMFGELRARLVFENARLADRILAELFDASSQAYIEAIATCLPGVSRRDLYYRFHYFLGAMFYAMSGSNRVKHLSRGLCDPSQTEAAIAHLVQFVCAGFRAAPLTGRKPRKRSS